MKNIFKSGFLILFLLVGCSPQLNKSLLNDLKELSSDKYEGRKTGTKGAELAADFIAQRFEDISLLPYTNNSYRQLFSFDTDNKRLTGTNIIGLVKGTSDKTMVISAHYDHLGVKNGKTYNGADDNISGVAALFYLADYFSKNKPYHTLIFAAFDAEEAGLKGSSFFVEDYLKRSSNIVLNINMDMIGISPKNEINIAGTYHYPFFREYIPESENKAKIRLGHDNIHTDRDDWTNQSDHYSFFEHGIPFLYFGVENHKHYHQPTDTYQNIHKKFYINTVKNILETIKNLDEGMMKRASFRKNLIH